MLTVMRKNNYINTKNSRMKKYISVFFSILCISLNLFAQEDIKPVVTEEYKPFDMQKYSAIFSDLSSKLITTDLLVDKVIQFALFDNYNGTDTSKIITYDAGRYLYSQVRGSQMQNYQQKLPAMDSILYDYSLKSELIKQFYPESQTEAEVQENGVSLGEMQMKLLQKIEELTIYAIQQQETIEKQQKMIEALQTKAENK
jgi:hypothetical protein